MMDKHRWDPQGFDDDATNGVDVDAVRAADRMLDAIAAGEKVDGADPLYRLLADARAESARDIPAAPVVDPTEAQDGSAAVTPLAGRRRRRAMRRAGGVAALGGVSLTSLVVGSGVAAALVVGGFTVGALTTGNSGSSGQSDSVVAESAQQSGGDDADTPRRSGDTTPDTSAPASEGHDDPSAPATDDGAVDHGADAGGMVLADPEPGTEAQPVDPTDTTGDGGPAADGGESAGDAEASEVPAETPGAGGPMVMAEPQRGAAAAPSKTTSTTSSTPSSTPKSQREPDEPEAGAEPSS